MGHSQLLWHMALGSNRTRMLDEIGHGASMTVTSSAGTRSSCDLSFVSTEPNVALRSLRELSVGTRRNRAALSHLYINNIIIFIVNWHLITSFRCKWFAITYWKMNYINICLINLLINSFIAINARFALNEISTWCMPPTVQSSYAFKLHLTFLIFSSQWH